LLLRRHKPVRCRFLVSRRELRVLFRRERHLRKMDRTG
jgi:hypothetical protein